MRIVSFLILVAGLPFYLSAQKAFPGAEGFGANASGGRGGRVIYVTNLNVSGPGSLAQALQEEGPRYILFKVSGVIPGTISVPAGRGNFTLAGQTSPGGIIVRGLEMYNENNPTVNNIIIRHIRSRIGDREKYPTPHWLAEDGITLGGVHNAIIDHCSFGHASDEAVDISRSGNLTLQNCILGETLGDHAYLGGMLINYSDGGSVLDNLSIHHNVWSRIGGRMPEISCETPFCNGKTVRLELSNNLFWDPQIELWYEGNTGFNGHFYVDMAAVNNLSVARPAYSHGMFHHDLLHFSQNRLYFAGNKLNIYPSLSDYDLFYCCNDFPSGYPNTDLGQAVLQTVKVGFPSISYHGTVELPGYISKNAGAFPRDAMDKRLMGYIEQNNMISTPVDRAGADDAFVLNSADPFPNDSDDDGMPDYWENAHGSNPAVPDHNETSLSLTITGEAGYTNLETYLNCLSDALVKGYTTSACGIRGFTTQVPQVAGQERGFRVFPSPAGDYFRVDFQERGYSSRTCSIELCNPDGSMVKTFSMTSEHQIFDISDLYQGLYIIRIRDMNGNVSLGEQKLVVSQR